jgi:Flp pilus assembly pilin Flp
VSGPAQQGPVRYDSEGGLVNDLHVILRSALSRSERGQTMAEYAVVLGVITLAIIAALVFLSGGINSGLSSVSSNI